MQYPDVTFEMCMSLLRGSLFDITGGDVGTAAIVFRASLRTISSVIYVLSIIVIVPRADVESRYVEIDESSLMTARSTHEDYSSEFRRPFA